MLTKFYIMLCLVVLYLEFNNKTFGTNHQVLRALVVLKELKEENNRA